MNNNELELSNNENGPNVSGFFTEKDFTPTNEEVKKEMSKPPNATRKRNFNVPNTIEKLNTYVKSTRRNNGKIWKNVYNMNGEHIANIKKMESLSFTKEFAKLILNAKLREYNLSLAKQRGRPNLSRLKYQVTERFRQAHAEGVRVFNMLLEKRKMVPKNNKILKGILTLLSSIKKNLSYIKEHIESIDKKY
jgi:hypothetical protein